MRDANADNREVRSRSADLAAVRVGPHGPGGLVPPTLGPLAVAGQERPSPASDKVTALPGRRE
jgi:hypothetical protein